MSRSRSIVGVLGVVLLLAAHVAWAQSKETGAIEGRVVDEQAQPLAGATVELSSDELIAGKRQTVTDGRGRYRFTLLPPGTYQVAVDISGFSPAQRANIALSVGMTLTVDFDMLLASFGGEVTVSAGAPVVDVKSSTTGEVTNSELYLQTIPTAASTLQIVSLAPGVTTSPNASQTGSAYGSELGSGVQVQTDGVIQNDPTYGYGGGVNLDYNVVKEARIMGLGAPAEYGGVEGVIANVVTKSGGNRLQGDVEYAFQDESWTSSDAAVSTLLPPAQQYTDINAHVGGAFVRDRLWFFGGARRVEREEEVTGYPEPKTTTQDAYFFKLTWQPTESTRLQAFLDYEPLDVANSGTAAVSFEAASWQESDMWVANLGLFQSLSAATFLEAKAGGWRYTQKTGGKQGIEVPAHTDLATGLTTDNSPTYGDGTLDQLTAQVAVTHYVDQFLGGSHDLKFGAQYDQGSSEFFTRLNGGTYYQDQGGAPFVRIDWGGFSSDTSVRVLGLYVQDSWRIGERLSLNLGVRYNDFTGKGEYTGETIYDESVVEPRLGLAYDLSGDGRTLVKAHYGWYYSGMKASYFKRVDDLATDQILNLYLGPQVGWVPFQVIKLVGNYAMDPEARHPRQEELTASVEQQLGSDASISVSAILRRAKDYILDVNSTALYEPIQYTDPGTGQTYTLYQQTNPSESRYLYTNPEAGDSASVIADAFKDYDGLQLLFNKRFSNNWMLMASYVYARTTGTVDNTYSSGQPNEFSFSNFSDPNRQLNLEGAPTYDPEHMFKLQGSAVLPYGFIVGLGFNYQSGTTYTRTLAVLLPQGLTNVLAEERGTRRLDPYMSLDLRVEKQFKLAGLHLIQAYVEAFNVLDRSVVTSVYPLAGPSFESPRAISSPRSIRAGLRYVFGE